MGGSLLTSPTLDGILLQTLVHGPDVVLVIDPSSGEIRWVNERILELSGWRPDELVGRRIQEFDSLTPQAELWEQMTENLPLGTVMVFAGRLRCRDGSTCSTEVRITLLEHDHERLMVASAREVEARTRVEARLRERENTLTAVIGALRDGVLVVNTDGIVTLANPRAAELAGLPLHQMLDRSILDVLDVRIDERGRPVTPSNNSLLHTLRTGESVNGLIQGVRGPDPRWLLVNTAPIVDPATGEVRGAVATNADITDLVTAQNELEELASRDVLTGLANRGRFRTHLQSAVESCAHTNDHIALLFLDLDGFKRVNDSLGHSRGDELLVVAANRIVDQLRPDDFVARLGGDEFVVLLPHLGTDLASATATAEQVADRVVQCLIEPFDLTSQLVRVTASIGIAMGKPAVEGAEELLRQADLAMYAAKDAGGVCHRVFNDRHDADAQRALLLDVQLREAVDHEDLALHLQPRLDVVTGELLGAEALLRWRDQRQHQVETAAIVATAERNGLIVPLGSWVLREAIRQATLLRDAGVLKAGMTLSVNVSSHQLQQDEFVPDLVAMLEAAGLPPEVLTVELTESAIMSDLFQARRNLRELNDIGIALSIDDFGTGYSSLAYLRELPVSELKLDRLFVTDLGRDHAAETIVRGVIDIADGLGLQTVAEGVERQDQLDFLRTTNCGQYQGYLTSPAIAFADFVDLYRG